MDLGEKKSGMFRSRIFMSAENSEFKSAFISGVGIGQGTLLTDVVVS